jgi:phage terminase large subunit GpA-like protein
VDAFPDSIPKEGTVVDLVRNRTNAYTGSRRKILWTSTPLVKQTSKIEKLYLSGTCEKFFVPCKHCGMMQELVWHGKDEDGYEYGIVWENDAKFRPILETVAYKCRNRECGGLMKNFDKAVIVPKGEWRETAEPASRFVKSFHITPLYNPPGMFSWEDMASLWAECWDIEKGRLRDKEKYRLFRNTKQGLTFEEGGVQIEYERAIRFRRTGFVTGKVPDDIALEETGSPVLFVCCSVDVQGDRLFIDVKGYSAGGSTWTLDFIEKKGNTAEFNGVWDDLDEFLSDRRYIGTDGKIYRILITLIDSGHNTEYVYEFAKRHSRGVYACKGKDWIESGATYALFSKDALDKIGMAHAYHVNTGKLKDKVSNSLMASFWRSGELQPPWYPNFPEDFRDDYFKMFEAETKQEKRDKITNQFKGYVWKLSFGQPNHALDTYVYNLAAMEIAAEAFCREALGLPALDWDAFWEEIKRTGEFYEPPDGKPTSA